MIAMKIIKLYYIILIVICGAAIITLCVCGLTLDNAIASCILLFIMSLALDALDAQRQNKK